MKPRRSDAIKQIEQLWGRKIKKAREKAGITQAEMAEQLNMTFSNYTKIERGVIGCRLGTAFTICKILGIKDIRLVL